MSFLKEKPSIQRIVPRHVVPGGRMTIMGSGFNGRIGNTSEICINGTPAHINCATSKSLTVSLPEEIEGEDVSLNIAGEAFTSVDLQIAKTLTKNVHPVDNPVLDEEGNIYTTLSGSRGEKCPVSVFMIRPDGTCESFLADIMNPTSMAFGPDRALYVSSRFNGVVYRVSSPKDVSVYAGELGTATGIVFDRHGNLLVGDRSGTVYCVTPERRVVPMFTIPPSVAAFHLCLGPDGSLYITNPDISTYDAILRIGPGETEPSVFYPGIKRPQGMAFDVEGNLYVAKAMAGDSGVIRISPKGKATMMASGPVLVGVAIDKAGYMILAGTSAIYRLRLGIPGLPLALTSLFSEPKMSM